MYLHDDPKILVAADKKGEKVTVVLDRSQRSENRSSKDFVNNAGIDLLTGF